MPWIYTTEDGRLCATTASVILPRWQARPKSPSRAAEGQSRGGSQTPRRGTLRPADRPQRRLASSADRAGADKASWRSRRTELWHHSFGKPPEVVARTLAEQQDVGDAHLLEGEEPLRDLLRRPDQRMGFRLVGVR